MSAAGAEAAAAAGRAAGGVAPTGLAEASHPIGCGSVPSSTRSNRRPISGSRKMSTVPEARSEPRSERTDGSAS